MIRPTRCPCHQSGIAPDFFSPLPFAKAAQLDFHSDFPQCLPKHSRHTDTLHHFTFNSFPSFFDSQETPENSPGQSVQIDINAVKAVMAKGKISERVIVLSNIRSRVSLRRGNRGREFLCDMQTKHWPLRLLPSPNINGFKQQNSSVLELLSLPL